MLKMAIITGFLSKTKDRFHEYNAPLELDEKFALMAEIEQPVPVLCAVCLANLPLEGRRFAGIDPQAHDRDLDDRRREQFHKHEQPQTIAENGTAPSSQHPIDNKEHSHQKSRLD